MMGQFGREGGGWKPSTNTCRDHMPEEQQARVPIVWAESCIPPRCHHFLLLAGITTRSHKLFLANETRRADNTRTVWISMEWVLEVSASGPPPKASLGDCKVRPGWCENSQE